MSNPKSAVALRIAPMYMGLFVGNAVYQNNISNYLRVNSLSDQWIGLLLGLVPIVGMAGQMLFGVLGDRMRMKNTLLLGLTALSTVAAVMLGVGSALPLIASMLCMYAFFQMSMEPILNAITLETLDKTGKSFGPIRMAGTVAFGLASPLIGYLMADDYFRMPIMLAIMLGASTAAVLLLPKVEGHARRGNRVSVSTLFKNKQLLIMTGFTFCLMVSMSFFYTFFPVYFTSEAVGGTSTLVGVCYFISAFSEIPFLLSSDRMFKRLGVGKMLMISAAMMSLRWILLFAFQNKYAIMATQLLHGMCFIVLTFVMVKFINLVVPDQLKASGQMFLTLIGMTLSRSVGAVISGFLSQGLGTREMFLCAAVISLASLAVFGVLIHRDPELNMVGRE